MARAEKAMANFLQANLRKRAPAYDLLKVEARRRGAGILLISEPSIRSIFDGATRDTNGTAVIQILDRGIPETAASEAGSGYAKKVVRDVAVYSCYYSPSDLMEKFVRELDALEESVRRSREPVVVTGDFNSKSPSWSGGPRDARGTALSDLMAALGLVLVNEAGQVTSHRGGFSSVLDLTFVSPVLMRGISGWRILDTETLSNHRHIFFRVDGSHKSLPPPAVGWHVKKLAEEKFREAIHLSPDILTVGSSPDEVVAALTGLIVSACDASMPRREAPPWGRRGEYWWTAGIGRLRAASNS